MSEGRMRCILETNNLNVGINLDDLSNVELWYHGTISIFENSFDKVKVKSSSRPMDFGSGFYLTENKEQAITWAKHRAKMFNKTPKAKNGRAKPMLVTCSIDLKNVKEFKFANFGQAMNEKLLNFIVDNRVLKSSNNNFDLVYGLVADGSELMDTLRGYHVGKYDLTYASRNIKYTEVQTQLCVRSSKFAERYVNILRKEIL